jgi:hypothetical protein
MMGCIYQFIFYKLKIIEKNFEEFAIQDFLKTIARNRRVLE